MKAKWFIPLCVLGLASCGVGASSVSTSLSEPEASQASLEESKSVSEEKSDGSPLDSKSSASASEDYNLVYNLPKGKTVQNLSESVISRTAQKALEDTVIGLRKIDGNAVISPASYILAVAGLSSVSASFNNAAFGFAEDAANDLMAMLEAWNFEYKVDSDYRKENTSFLATVLHQQVGDCYRFDETKRQQMANKYISTMVSSLGSYNADANRYFQQDLGFHIDAPDPGLTNDAVLTYGAFKMKDSIPQGLRVRANPFLVSGEMTDIDTFGFGTKFDPANYPYYEGEDYVAFEFPIRQTKQIIVLPNEGKDLGDIDVAEAFAEFKANRKNAYMTGYVPFFHNHTDGVDISEAMKKKMTGSEVLYDRLLEDSVINDLAVTRVLQTSDFEFGRYGVEGESITVIVSEGTAFIPLEEEPIRIEVNRPFYAISTMDDFPIFVNKVVVPNLEKQPMD